MNISIHDIKKRNADAYRDWLVADRSLLHNNGLPTAAAAWKKAVI